MSVAQWFAKNRTAAQFAVRKSQTGVSQRSLIPLLQQKFDFPYRDHTALGDWFRASSPTTAAIRRSKPEPERFLRSDREVKALDKVEDFFVTCAVSSSPVCAPALRALEKAAEECNGRILCTPIRYVNPTRRDQDSEEWWDGAVRPYLLENEVRPHPLLSLMATKVAATANNPLPPRLDGMTKARSAVYGHPQLAMRTVATPQEKLPKILYTSGAITERSYSDTLAGALAHFHHSVAAVKVEVRGKKFHLREIRWDGSKFIDIDREYRPNGIYDAERAKALILGDIHVGLDDEEVLQAIFGGSNGMIDTLDPELLVLHDLFDGRTVNPHERGNALIAATRARQSVADEIESVKAWLDMALDQSPDDMRIAVVRSNHDIFLDRWLESGHAEPRDKELFHWLSWKMLETHRLTGEFPNPLELALGELDERIKFLKLDESLQVSGQELGSHGHLGPDGARGSPANLARIGTRGVYGHVHSPRIWQGTNFVGLTARYRHGYNHGYLSWLHTMLQIAANGATQMLHCIGKDWRG